MAVDFKAFKAKVNTEEAAQLEEKYKQNMNSGNYAPLPSGVYPVEIEKMEVGQSSWGTDQINITFNITEGDHEGQKIFYNGTFDTHFAHGFGQTARLISELTDKGLDENSILYNITKDVQTATDYIADLFEALDGQYGYDLDYQVQISKKVNPNTNKPYENHFFSVQEVFDLT